jgi:predicted AlkP superfamily pyrophosphatase or phosphodiesterase
MSGGRLLACLLGFLLWTPLTAAHPPVKKALIIGIDGCRPDALLAAEAPQLHGLIKDGAFSDKAQASDLTVSGPGWSSLLTGVWWEKHGIRDNGFKGANFGEFPHLLTRYKKANPRGVTASVAHWSGIAKIVTEADHATTHKTGVETAKVACQVLAEKNPDILFVHFDDVDGAGHKNGFSPKEAKYLEAITRVDALIGDVLKTMNERKTFAGEDWLIVVSTDHGGSGKGHGQNIPEHRTIFLIVSGKSAAKGTIDPAPTLVDIAPTVLTHMGLAIDPAWKLDGQAVGLKAAPQKQ